MENNKIDDDDDNNIIYQYENNRNNDQDHDEQEGKNEEKRHKLRLSFDSIHSIDNDPFLPSSSPSHDSKSPSRLKAAVRRVMTVRRLQKWGELNFQDRLDEAFQKNQDNNSSVLPSSRKKKDSTDLLSDFGFDYLDEQLSSREMAPNCDIYAAFSPGIVHRHLYKSWVKDEDKSISLPDISGFTSLATRLSAEELKDHINEYFTLLINVVTRYAGDVIKFCGDAVMIIWPILLFSLDEFESIEIYENLKIDMANVATKCGLALLDECGEYDKGHGLSRVSLRLHCGLGAGRMHGYYVTANGRSEFLVAGDPIRQISEAEKEAKVGEIILSPEIVSLLSKDELFQLNRTDLGNYLLIKELLTPSKLSRRSSLKNVRDSFKQMTETISNALPSARGKKNNPLDELKDIKVKDNLENNSEEKTKPRFINKLKDLLPASSKIFPLDNEEKESIIPILPDSKSIINNNNNNNNIEKKKLEILMKNSILKNRTLDNLSDTNSNVTTSIFSPLATPKDDIKSDYSLSNLNNDNIKNEKRVSLITEYVDLQKNHETSIKLLPCSKDLRTFVHETARYAVESKTLDYIAELRMVTTLFIQIIGLENDLSRGRLKRVQETMESSASCFSKFRGAIRQFVLDDKGCVLIGGFGLPNYTHEDNDERALETAFYIRIALKGLGLKTKIGIARGRVYCGLVGSEYRCEYAMVGTSVNLAARLMSSCDNDEIRVDGIVYRNSNHNFAFNELGSINAKGYIDPVEVYSPIKRLKADLPKIFKSIDIVFGRDKEKSYIKEGLRQLKDIEYKINIEPIAFLGEAGIGKSHLINSIKKYCNIEKLNILISSGIRVHENTALFIWQQIIEQILEYEISLSDLELIEENLQNIYGNKKMENIIRPDFKKYASSRVSDDIFSIESVITQLSLFMPLYLSYDNHNYELSDLILLLHPLIKLQGNIKSFYRKSALNLRDTINPHPNSDFKHHENNEDQIFNNNNFSNENNNDGFDNENNNDGFGNENNNNNKNNKNKIKKMKSLDSNVQFHDVQNLDSEVKNHLREVFILEIIRRFSIFRPIVIIIDNFQWIDATSYQLLIHLLNFTIDDNDDSYHQLNSLHKKNSNDDINNKKLLKNDHHMYSHNNYKFNMYLILLSRTFNNEEYKEIYDRVNKIYLKGLNEDECLDLLEFTIGDQLMDRLPLDEKSLNGKILLEKTGGNPLFIKNLALTYRDALENNKAIKNLSDLPEGITEVIIDRFDNLNVEHQLVLKIASIIGVTFGHQILSHVVTQIAPQHSGSLHAILIELISSNFIGRKKEGGEYVFYFIHSSVQDIIYSMMLKSHRESFHRVIAEYYESRYGSSIDHLSLLVHHWSRSNIIPKRIEYLEKAALHYKNEGFDEEVVFYYLQLVAVASGIDITTVQYSEESSKKDLQINNNNNSNNNNNNNNDNNKIKTIKHEKSRKHGWRQSITTTLGFNLTQEYLKDLHNKKIEENKKINEKTLKKSSSSIGNIINLKNKWMSAGDFTLTDKLINAEFSSSQIGYWLAEVALARFRLGNLKAAFNRAQMALLYMDMDSIPTSSKNTPNLIESTNSFKQNLMLNAYGPGVHSSCASCLLSLNKKKNKRNKLYSDESILLGSQLYENTAMISFLRSHSFIFTMCLFYEYSQFGHDILFLDSSAYARLCAGLSLAYLIHKKKKESEYYYQEATHLAEKYNETKTMGIIKLTLSIYLSMKGEWMEANDMIIDSMHYYDLSGEYHSLLQAQMFHGWILFFQGKIIESLDIFRNLKIECIDYGNKFLLNSTREALSLIYILIGDKKYAKENLSDLQLYLGPNKSHVMIASLKILYYSREKNYKKTAKHIKYCLKKFSKLKQCNFIIGIFIYFIIESILSMLEGKIFPFRDEELLKDDVDDNNNIVKNIKVYGPKESVHLLNELNEEDYIEELTDNNDNNKNDDEDEEKNNNINNNDQEISFSYSLQDTEDDLIRRTIRSKRQKRLFGKKRLSFPDLTLIAPNKLKDMMHASSLTLSVNDIPAKYEKFYISSLSSFVEVIKSMSEFISIMKPLINLSIGRYEHLKANWEKSHQALIQGIIDISIYKFPYIEGQLRWALARLGKDIKLRNLTTFNGLIKDILPNYNKCLEIFEEIEIKSDYEAALHERNIYE